MSDNFDKVLRQLRHHGEILKHHKRSSGTIGRIITNMTEAQILLNRYPDSAEAKAAVSQLMRAKDSAKNAIDAANTYIDIVAEILGENTVSEEVLAFLRVENRLTDLNMAEVSLLRLVNMAHSKAVRDVTAWKWITFRRRRHYVKQLPPHRNRT